MPTWMKGESGASHQTLFFARWFVRDDRGKSGVGHNSAQARKQPHQTTEPRAVSKER